jgi:hypothetical protein
LRLVWVAAELVGAAVFLPWLRWASAAKRLLPDRDQPYP